MSFKLVSIQTTFSKIEAIKKKDFSLLLFKCWAMLGPVYSQILLKASET